MLILVAQEGNLRNEQMLFRDLFLQPRILAWITVKQRRSDHSDRSTTSVDGGHMGSTIYALCQSRDNGKTLTNESFSDLPCIARALFRRITGANHGHAWRRRKRPISTVIEEFKRMVRFSQATWILGTSVDANTYLRDPVTQLLP